MKIKRNFKEDEFVKRISSEEFRESGALWFINQTLHLFGMAIVWDLETDEIYPAIVKFRGFDTKNNDEGYKRMTEYLKDNISEMEDDL